MFTPDRGWALGGAFLGEGRILYTADGGERWQDVTPPLAGPFPLSSPPLPAAFFLNADTAWVLYPGSDARVWRTSDAGATWAPSEPLSFEGPFIADAALVFGSPSSGLLVATLEGAMMQRRFALLRTQDGGDTWRPIPTPFEEDIGCPLSGLTALDEKSFFWMADCAGSSEMFQLYYSADHGATWQLIALPPPPEAPDLFTPGQGYCFATAPTFPGPFNARLFGYLTVTCRRNHDKPADLAWLYVSQDRGVSWTPRTLPPADALFIEGSYLGHRIYDVLFVDAQRGWAYTQSAYQAPDGAQAFARTLYRTQDGGLSWERLMFTSWQGLFHFINSELGWALAYADDEFALLRTQDGGDTWRQLEPTIGLSLTFSLLVMHDPQQAWALAAPSGKRHTLTQSMDGGRAWEPLRRLPLP
jgi:photosystem II stability/assembly factor-like uncharacterized protein